MSRESGEWNRATRIKNGGVHAYIGKDAVMNALQSAGIPTETSNLAVKVHWLKTSRKGRARILIELKENDQDAKQSIGANLTAPLNLISQQPSSNPLNLSNEKLPDELSKGESETTAGGRGKAPEVTT